MLEERKEGERPHTKTQNNSNIPWVEKYRPTHLEELISHEGILTTCSILLKQ